jgi:hypothetical protein
VARLDGQTLTLDDVTARLDSARGMTRAQVAEYARRWVNDEILYREIAGGSFGVWGLGSGDWGLGLFELNARRGER